jgi:hypothetical protein
MNWDFESMSGLYEFGRYLLREAPKHNAWVTEQALGTFFSTPWNSNLEALEEFRTALHSVEKDIEQQFPHDMQTQMVKALQAVDQAARFWFTSPQAKRPDPNRIR